MTDPTTPPGNARTVRELFARWRSGELALDEPRTHPARRPETAGRRAGEPGGPPGNARAVRELFARWPGDPALDETFAENVRLVRELTRLPDEPDDAD